VRIPYRAFATCLPLWAIITVETTHGEPHALQNAAVFGSALSQRYQWLHHPQHEEIVPRSLQCLKALMYALDDRHTAGCGHVCWLLCKWFLGMATYCIHTSMCASRVLFMSTVLTMNFMCILVNPSLGSKDLISLVSLVSHELLQGCCSLSWCCMLPAGGHDGAYS